MEIFADVNMVRWLLSVLVLILLLGSFALIAPYIGKKRNTFSINNKKKKLSIVETLYIDQKRKVIMFRAGDIEHTILTGVNKDIHLSAEPINLEEELEIEEDISIGFLKEIPSEKDKSSKKTKTNKSKKGKKHD